MSSLPPHAVADADQQHARVVEIRDQCSRWGEIGFLAQQRNLPHAAMSAASHLLATFGQLGATEQAMLINYMFVNTVALAAEQLYGDDVNVEAWLLETPQEYRDFVNDFMATNGTDCCEAGSRAHGAEASFMEPHLTKIDIDGESV